jgi:succinyl-CoA synthetase beta subunit
LKIHEFQAREILKKHGVPVPPFEVVSDPGAARRAAAAFGGLVVVKAQVHAGGRGKAGGVKLARDPAEAEAKASAILGMTIKGLVVKRVIVARAVDIDREYYAGIVVDRASKRPVVMVSASGGVDIEEVARATPERIVRRPVDPEGGLDAKEAAALAASIEERPAQASAVAEVLVRLYRAFAESDCSLAEINPVVVTPEGRVWAVDAKMNIDDNALDRHPDLEALRDTDGETREDALARGAGLSYVKLDGNVGCLVNGAGLAMATMDLIKHYGGEPANFLDIGGSSSPEKVVTALDIITSDEGVRAVLINIFGGITRCDDVATGLVQAFAARRPAVPVVVRLTGTNEERAGKILAGHGLACVTSMDEAVQKAVELAGRGTS